MMISGFFCFFFSGSFSDPVALFQTALVASADGGPLHDVQWNPTQAPDGC
jgi:hypothetical protein